MIATGAVGNWLGERALDRMGEQALRLVFRTILTLLGLRLIWVAIAEWYERRKPLLLRNAGLLDDALVDRNLATHKLANSSASSAAG